MITLTVLSILGVALAAVLVAMFRGRPASNQSLAPTQSRAAVSSGLNSGLNTDPWDARRGDVVSIKAAAEDFADLDFPVDRRSAYQAANHRWIDLSGEFRGRRVYLEVFRHPRPDLIGILDARKLTLSEVGVTEEQLAALDARQDPTAFFQFEGRQWLYESSREIGYFENETGAGEGLYRWQFHEQGGPRLLCIEKWEGEPFDVRIARRLQDRDITVYRAA